MTAASRAVRHTCAVAIDHERWVAYWANELGEAEVAAIDEQMFVCDGCAADGQRVSTVVEAFRTMVPPVIDRTEVEALRAKGHVLRDNEFLPGVRMSVVFERDVDFLIHHLRGLELGEAERVSVRVWSESRGTLFEDLFAPFDRERGEVLIACQKHFASLPNDIAFDVHVYRAGGYAETTVQTFYIPHEFR